MSLLSQTTTVAPKETVEKYKKTAVAQMMSLSLAETCHKYRQI